MVLKVIEELSKCFKSKSLILNDDEEGEGESTVFTEGAGEISSPQSPYDIEGFRELLN
jgi:hypothetical protein